MPSIEDRGHTDRITTPTRATLRSSSLLMMSQWKPTTTGINQSILMGPNQDATIYF